MATPQHDVDVDVHRQFPNDPFFAQLLSTSRENYDRTVINDSYREVRVSYAQLFHDVSALRKILCANLPSNIEDGLVQNEGLYICVLAPTSYEFIVSLLAILAIGAVVVPLPTGLMPEEAVYLINKCNASCLLVAPEEHGLAQAIENHGGLSASKHLQQILIEVPQRNEVSTFNYSLHERPIFSPERPGLVLFTSGTTGPPKGVVHARKIFHQLVKGTNGHKGVILCHRSIFWGGGLFDVLSPIGQGTRLEIFKPGVKADLILERIRQGDLTILRCPPGIWLHMMRIYEEKIINLPHEELQEYAKGVQSLHIAECSSGTESPRVMQFWQNMRNGKSLTVSYGTTELGTVIMSTSQERSDFFKQNLGNLIPGNTAKLSHGASGEILAKTPTMFLGYLDDIKSTRADFDDEGFYKTGDLAHLDGGEFVFDGRVSSDFVRVHAFKVPRLEVESQLLELPYIFEAHILAVRDSQTRHRVSALVRLRPGFLESCHEKETRLTLKTLREDLSPRLSLFKLPTALRILADYEEIPRTATFKFSPEEAIRRYFPLSEDGSLRHLSESVELWDMTGFKEIKPQKAWDWSGLIAS